MKEGWEIRKLGDLCTFVRGPFGGSLKKNIFKSSGYAVYEQQHAIYNQFNEVRYFIDEAKFNEMKRFEIQAGDIIMSCSGTMGKVAIVPKEFNKGIINQALLKISTGNKLSNQYLKLYMQSENFQRSLLDYSGGAAIQNVASVSTLKDIKIPLPPMFEQASIVTLINNTFAAIDKAKANAEQNLKNAKELFESYLEEVFDRKDWPRISLRELTSLLGDGLHGTPRYSKDGEYYFINGNNLNEGNIEFKDSTRRVDINEYIKHKKHLNDRTVLVSINGTLGKIAFYNGEKIILGKSACYFNLKNNVDKHYIKYVLSSRHFVNYANREATGATIKNVSLKTMREFNVPIPSLEEQRNIVNKLNLLESKTRSLKSIYQCKIHFLDSLKITILRKVYTGGLKVLESSIKSACED